MQLAKNSTEYNFDHSVRDP